MKRLLVVFALAFILTGSSTVAGGPPHGHHRETYDRSAIVTPTPELDQFKKPPLFKKAPKGDWPASFGWYAPM